MPALPRANQGAHMLPRLIQLAEVLGDRHCQRPRWPFVTDDDRCSADQHRHQACDRTSTVQHPAHCPAPIYAVPISARKRGLPPYQNVGVVHLPRKLDDQNLYLTLAQLTAPRFPKYSAACAHRHRLGRSAAHEPASTSSFQSAQARVL